MKIVPTLYIPNESSLSFGNFEHNTSLTRG